MKQMTQDFFTFELPLDGSPLKSIHCYFIKGNPRNLVIDTSFNQDKSEQTFLEQLAEVGASPENTDIFLTHMHVDHSGLIARLKCSTNCVYASTLDKKLVDGFQDPTHWQWITNCNLYTGAPEEHSLKAEQHVAFLNRPSALVDITCIQDGDILTVGSHIFRIVSLAGHTPGQIGLWEDASGSLFSGDHILDSISPNITAWDLEEDYLGIFLKNLCKVQDMPVKHLYPAHRKTPADLNGRIEEIINHHRTRLSSIVDAVRKANEPVSAFYIAQRIPWSSDKKIPELPLQQRWFAFSETLAHLQHLYFSGLLHRNSNSNETLLFSMPV